MLYLESKLLYPLTAIIIFLAVSHLIVLILSKVFKEKDFSNLKQRMNSWWAIVAVLIFIFLGNRAISLFIVALICFMSLHEFFAFTHFNEKDKKLLFWAYLSIPIQLLFLYYDWLIMFYLFVPLYMFFIIPLRRVLLCETNDFIRVTGIIQWGMLLNVYCLGYLGAFLALPNTSDQTAGKLLLLFLFFINTINDASQYIWGKSLGKRKIVPAVSPKKTWEGFLGGVLTTTCISILIAPCFMQTSIYGSLAIGLLISVFGFVGDVVMSAIKRDAGVKDSSQLIPGHGGILDRVDSLSFTAPLFFHFYVYFYITHTY